MKYLCTLHNIHFDYENPNSVTHECPYCMREELVKLRAEYQIVKKQRDTLVEAIGIVKTVQELK